MKINGKTYDSDSYCYRDHAKISELEGKIFSRVFRDGETIILTNDEEVYAMLHSQDCCENVNIEDICGDLSDLENFPLLIAREDTDSGSADYGTYTWTFYNFSTNRGSVTIRWYGTSNGYYSESVNLYCLSEVTTN